MGGLNNFKANSIALGYVIKLEKCNATDGFLLNNQNIVQIIFRIVSQIRTNLVLVTLIT